MTAVNWLDEQIQERVIAQDVIARKMIIEISMEDYMKLKQEAIELEKEQITDAYYIGSQDAPIKKGKSEQYYNETFKKDL